MRDKKTIVIGIAGAIAILLATTIATACIRGCSADAGDDTIQQTESGQQSQVTDLESMLPEEAAKTILVGNAWEAEGATLTVKDGRYVEVKGDKQVLVTFDVKQAAEQEGGYALIARIDATQSADAHDASITIAKDAQGVWTVASDEFAYARAYTQSAATREPVKVVDLTTDILDLIDGDEAGLTAAIQAYAKSSVPGAATAVWTGEVLLDFNKGTVTTTFDCDDPANTLLTVMRDASGGYTVAG